MQIVYPDPLLEVRVQFLDLPVMTSLCAGYEGGQWRSSALADHLFQWLPYAALNREHHSGFGVSNFVELLKLASAHVYNTKKTASRGELGELLLHLACISQFGTVPIMCKLLLKSSSNDTVKGFDGVHLLVKDGEIELWLGESKFYKDGKRAIVDAIESIQSHMVPAFLNTEKAMVLGHVDADLPNRSEVISLLKQTTSSDILLKRSVFPVLIAYESGMVNKHSTICDEYIHDLTEESKSLRFYFAENAKGIPLRIQLIFVPLGIKADVVSRFDAKLEAFL